MSFVHSFDYLEVFRNLGEAMRALHRWFPHFTSHHLMFVPQDMDGTNKVLAEAGCRIVFQKGKGSSAEDNRADPHIVLMENFGGSTGSELSRVAALVAFARAMTKICQVAVYGAIPSARYRRVPWERYWGGHWSSWGCCFFDLPKGGVEEEEKQNIARALAYEAMAFHDDRVFVFFGGGVSGDIHYSTLYTLDVRNAGCGPEKEHPIFLWTRDQVDVAAFRRRLGDLRVTQCWFANWEFKEVPQPDGGYGLRIQKPSNA